MILSDQPHIDHARLLHQPLDLKGHIALHEVGPLQLVRPTRDAVGHVKLGLGDLSEDPGPGVEEVDQSPVR